MTRLREIADALRGVRRAYCMARRMQAGAGDRSMAEVEAVLGHVSPTVLQRVAYVARLAAEEASRVHMAACLVIGAAHRSIARTSCSDATRASSPHAN